MRIKFGIPLTLHEICKAVGAPLPIYNKEFNYLSTDTRTTRSGDLFIALKGENDSGENYVDDAIKIDAIPICTTIATSGIHVADTQDALFKLAKYYLTKLINLKQRVCITGSVGKTTTKEFLSYIVSFAFKTHCTEGNYNNAIGVPLTILTANQDTEILVLEFGTNSFGEIAALSSLVCPTVSIITNIGTAHIGNFGSKEMIAKEKLSIISGMARPLLLCEFGESLLESVPGRVTVSCENRDSDYFLFPIQESTDGCVFDFFSADSIIDNLHFKLSGRHILHSLAFAISASLIVGVSEKIIADAVGRINEDKARHRFIKTADFIILDDSYNASRESVFADILYLDTFKGIGRSAVLGDILELGSMTEAIHREIGKFAYQMGIEKLYLFGVYSVFTAMGAIDAGMDKRNIFINTDINNPSQTAMDIRINHKNGEIILFKASHKIGLGRIIDMLTKNEEYDNHDT